MVASGRQIPRKTRWQGKIVRDELVPLVSDGHTRFLQLRDVSLGTSRHPAGQDSSETGRQVGPFAKRGELLFPRVEHRHPCLIEIAPVACNNRKSMVKGGRRKHKVGV